MGRFNLTEILFHFPVNAFAKNLLTWFEAARRPLPWRETNDPYAILVSEIMLQQTQVKTVIPYYQRFMDLFPNAKALAEADEASLLKAWEGLGYYRRARNLQKAARQIMTCYDGVFPCEPRDIAALAGVGPYTCAAVASIAFNRCLACLDGNVIRVLTRLFAWDEDVTRHRALTLLRATAQRMISPTQPGVFNEAMMELGATICTPKQPACLSCPMRSFCLTAKRGENPTFRPNKPRRVQPSKMDFESVFLSCGDKFLVAQRLDGGLMASMWELPSQSRADYREWPSLFVERIAFQAQLKAPLLHKFSHLHASYFVKIYRCPTETGWCRMPKSYSRFAWVNAEELKRLPSTKVLHKLLPDLLPHLKGQIAQPEPFLMNEE